MDPRDKISVIQNLMQVNKFDEAIYHCNKLIKQFPNISYFYNLCGLAHQGNKQMLKSIELFTQAIHFEPENVAAKNNLANSYKYINQNLKAEEIFKSIIAEDPNGLQVISACCSDAKVKVEEIKFLKKNKIFLLLIERLNKENDSKEKIKGVCKFEFVDDVKSKNIDQKNKNNILQLVAINLFKVGEKFEITLLFKNNAFITLLSEVLEVTLEDQNKLND